MSAALFALVAVVAAVIGYRLWGRVSPIPSLALDDAGFTQTFGNGSTVRREWVDCSPFAGESSGGRVPGVDVTWTFNGKPESMASEMVDARDLGALLAEMNQRREAALARRR